LKGLQEEEKRGEMVISSVVKQTRSSIGKGIEE